MERRHYRSIYVPSLVTKENFKHNEMTKRITLLALLTIQFSLFSFAQPDRWQQKVKYNMNVNMDVATNKLTGTEKLEYTNNSPDTLNKFFMHLYWNAFQPNSSMAVRRNEYVKTVVGIDKNGKDVYDNDARTKAAINTLKPDEIGYQHVKSIKINGVEQKLVEHETILEVLLSKPLLPKTKTMIDVVFEAQVPLLIRRAGRGDANGIAYSMGQWYPKMVEYDYQGWNANPYINREFYGVWGDFDVKITMDKDYMIGATGVLQNPNSIGMGYSTPGLKMPRNTNKTMTWNFIANNVHDFVWAADQGYAHLSKEIRKDLTIHVIYKATTASNDSAWSNILWAAEKVLPFIESKFGKYPYPQYSFIQGGDGGMEYAMATLLKGPGFGGVFHEWMHNWYQHVLGTNESLASWMDEGFATFAEYQVTDYYNTMWAQKSPYAKDSTKLAAAKAVEKGKTTFPLIHTDAYTRYFSLVKSGLEEPMTTHADHFNTNFAYSVASYFKGSIFLNQLGYIIGQQTLDKVLLEYYNQWKFKHPNANDFIRLAEKLSGIELQWYKEEWVNGTKAIDYALGGINTDSVSGKALLTIKRVNKAFVPMPIDVLVTYKDGSKELHYIPLSLMYGQKPAEDATPRTVHTEWRWTHPEYTFGTSRKVGEIKSIEIDPTQRMADVNRNNNKVVIPD